MSLPEPDDLLNEIMLLALESDTKALDRFRHYVHEFMERIYFPRGRREADEEVEDDEEVEVDNSEILDDQYATLRYVAARCNLPLAYLIFDHYRSDNGESSFFITDFVSNYYFSDFFQQLVTQMYELGQEKRLLDLGYERVRVISELVLLLQNRPLMKDFADNVLVHGSVFRDLIEPHILDLLLTHASDLTVNIYFSEERGGDQFYKHFPLPTFADPRSMRAVTHWNNERFMIAREIRKHIAIWNHRYPPGGRPSRGKAYPRFKPREEIEGLLAKYTVYTLDPELMKKLFTIGIHPRPEEIIEYMKVLPTHPILKARKATILRMVAMDRRGPLLALRRVVRKETENEEEGWAVYAKLLRDLGEEDEAPRRTISPPRGGAGASPRARSPRK
jgi:hypothetical protein